MSIVTKNKIKAAQKLIALKKTRTITEDDLFLPEWETLKKEYDSHQNGEWIDKAIVSLLNSAIFQRRVVFVLAKRPFRELAKSDKNWKRSIGLKDENWKVFIQEITGRDIVKCIHRADKGSFVYEIVENDILDLINIDISSQREEAIKFANEMNDLEEGTSEGTTKGNREVEEEREVEGETKINQPNSFKEEDLEIDLDLSMDSYPTSTNLSTSKEMRNKFVPAEGEADQWTTLSSQSPEKTLLPNAPVRSVAQPVLNQQKQAPVMPKQTTPSVTTPKEQVSSEAILAKWKPNRVDSKDLENQVAELFTTLKHYSIPKDELSTKKIIKTMFGPTPSKKIDWLIEKATQAIDEQRELIYAPEIDMQQAPLEVPVTNGKPGQLRRKNFLTDDGYALYYDAFTSGREIWNLGGSIVEYYEQQAYVQHIPIIKFTPK